MRSFSTTGCPETRVGRHATLGSEVRQLEMELQYLVFDLYGLPPGEVQLLRTTAPPLEAQRV